MHPKITSSKVYDMSMCDMRVRAGVCAYMRSTCRQVWRFFNVVPIYPLWNVLWLTHTRTHTYLVFRSCHSPLRSLSFWGVLLFCTIHVSYHNVASLESGMFVRMRVLFVHVVHDFLRTHSSRIHTHTDIHTHIPYTLCHVLFNYHIFA